MKKSISVFLVCFFLFSCEKSEETKGHIDVPVPELQHTGVSNQQKTDSGALVETLNEDSIAHPNISSGALKKTEKDLEVIAYKDADIALSFDHPKAWKVQSAQDTFEGSKRQIITIHTDSFKIGKSLREGERSTNIEIELFISDKKETVDVPYGMFFGEEFLKSISGKNGKTLFVKGYIHYLSDNPMTDETPGVVPYRKEIEFYNTKYAPIIKRLIESIYLP